MSIVDTETGEVLAAQVVELTRDQAERLTGRIAEKVIDAHSLILQAMQGRADKALGYDSWQAYVEDRFPLTVRQVAREVRPELVAQLRSEGHSFRAIASTLGVSEAQAHRDLSTVTSVTVQPERVVGIDGKSRPATRTTVEVLCGTCDRSPEKCICEKVDDPLASTSTRSVRVTHDPNEICRQFVQIQRNAIDLQEGVPFEDTYGPTRKELADELRAICNQLDDIIELLEKGN